MTLPPGSFHLRRVAGTGDHHNSHNNNQEILLNEVTKFGRNAESVDVVLTSAVYSNMISRDHAQILAQKNSAGNIECYFIKDNSLNGTYINDVRVKDVIKLEENVVIKFGHMNGAAIKPGSHAPQANAEFSFSFERAMPNRAYLGFNQAGERTRILVCQGNGQGIAEGPPAKKDLHKANGHHEVPSSTINEEANRHRPGHPALPIPSASNLPVRNPSYFPSGTDLQLLNALYQGGGALQQQLAAYQMRMPSLNSSLPMSSILQQGYNMSSLMGSPFAPPGVSFPLAGGVGVAGPPPVPFRAPVEQESQKARCAPALGSPQMECDSSVPSPPKTATSTSSGAASAAVGSSSSPIPRKDEEDTYSVPDSPPRAPPSMLARRSVTNSPAPSPSEERLRKERERLEEEEQCRKEKEAAAALNTLVAARRVVPPAPGKSPKGVPAAHKKNEASRLLDDLTEGSFMAIASRRNSTGAGSDRRRLQDEGGKQKQKKAKQHAMGRQISDVSSEEDSDEEEEVKPRVRQSNGKAVAKKRSRPSKASSDSDDSDHSTKKKRKKSGKKAEQNKSVKRGASAKKAKAAPPDSDSDSPPLDTNFVDSVDTSCASPTCTKPTIKAVNWIECELCKQWFHNICVFGSNRNVEDAESIVYYCKVCEAKRKKKKSMESGR